MGRKLREDEAQAICLLCGWTKTVCLTDWLPEQSPSLAASEALLAHRRASHSGANRPPIGGGFRKAKSPQMRSTDETGFG